MQIIIIGHFNHQEDFVEKKSYRLERNTSCIRHTTHIYIYIYIYIYNIYDTHTHTHTYIYIYIWQGVYIHTNTYVCVCVCVCIYILRFQSHFKFMNAEPDKGLKGPKHVACITTQSSVRRYWSVYLLKTVITAECPPSS